MSSGVGYRGKLVDGREVAISKWKKPSGGIPFCKSESAIFSRLMYMLKKPSGGILFGMSELTIYSRLEYGNSVGMSEFSIFSRLILEAHVTNHVPRPLFIFILEHFVISESGPFSIHIQPISLQIYLQPPSVTNHVPILYLTY